MPQLPQIRSRSLVQAPNTRLPDMSEGVVNAALGLAGTVARGYEAEQFKLAREKERMQLEQKAAQQRQQDNEDAVYVINAESRLGQRANEALQAAQTQPDGMPGVTDRLLKDFDAWGKEETEAAAPSARPKLSLSLARQRAQISQHVAGVEMKARQDKLITDFGDGLDVDRKLVFADPAQFNHALARRTVLANSLDLPEAVRNKLLDHTRDTLSFEAGSALVERDPDAFLKQAGVAGAKTGKDGKPLPSDPAKAAEAVKNDPVLSNLPPDRLRQLVDRATMLSVQRQQLATAEQERRDRQAEIHLHKAGAAAQAFQMMADKGTILDPAFVKATLAQTAGTPYHAVVMSSAQQAQATGGLANQPMGAQQAALDALDTEIAQKGRSPELDKRREQVEKVVNGTREDVAKDALGAGLQRGWVRAIPPIDMSGGIQSIAQQIGPRVQAADAVSYRTGKSESPFRPQEIPLLRQQFEAMSPADKGQNLAMLASSIPPGQMQAVAKQLDQHDRVLSLAFKVGASKSDQGLPAARLVFLGQQWLRDNGKKGTVDSIPDQRVKDMAGVIGQAVPGAVRQDVIDTASLIYLGKLADGQSASAKKSAELALGGSIIQHNGSPIVTPGAMSQDRFRQGLRTVTADQISKQVTDGAVFSSTGDRQSVPDFLTDLPVSQLIQLGEGRYGVRMGAGIALNAQGKPLEIEVR